jgi:hypothetical protein
VTVRLKDPNRWACGRLSIATGMRVWEKTRKNFFSPALWGQVSLQIKEDVLLALQEV